MSGSPTKPEADPFFSITSFFRSCADYKAVLALDALILQRDIDDTEKQVRLNELIQKTLAGAKIT